MSKRMIDSEVADKIKYRYDDPNEESHIDIESNYVNVSFLKATDGIITDGQVDASNIVTDTIKTFNSSGEITIDASIKPKGGLSIIESLDIGVGKTINIITKRSDNGLGGTNFFGTFRDNGFAECPCFGNYLDVNHIYPFIAMVILDQDAGYQKLKLVTNDPSTGEITKKEFAFVA